MNRADSHPSHNSSNSRDWLHAALVSLGVSIAILAPFFWLGNASGHDISFHAASWVDVAVQWKEGILFPRWSEWANYGYGEPRFIFYPPLSWILGGALVSLVSIKAAAGAFVVLVQTFAGTSAYALAKKFASRGGALAAAACFAANPDALLIIYVRSDYAELLAMAFYPLLILVVLQLCGWFGNLRDGKRKHIVLFALSFAAIWLANAPAGVIASYSAALLFAWAAITQKSWKPATRGAAGIALGLGLAAFYLIPAAYEQRWVNISQALSAGLAPRENFLFAGAGDPDHNHFNHVASAAAVLTMILIAAFAWITWRDINAGRERGMKDGARRAWTALVLLAMAASLLMVNIALPLWRVLPELRFVQFPWRWTSILAVVFCPFLAWGLTGRKRPWVWLAGVLVLLAGCGTYLAKNTWWDADDFPTIQYDVELGHGFEGTDEYDPLGDDHLDLAQKQPRAQLMDHHPDSGSANVDVEVWTPENRVVRVQTRYPALVALRLLDYPAWRFSVNGGPVRQKHLSGVQAVTIPVPAGTSVVRAEFARTPDRTIGGLVSAASLLAVGLLWLDERKRVRGVGHPTAAGATTGRATRLAPEDATAKSRERAV